MNLDQLTKLARRIVRKYSIQGYEKEDLEQEVLMQFIPYLDKSIDQESLTNIARQHLRSLIREANRVNGVTDFEEVKDDLLDDSPSPLSVAYSKECLDRLSDLLTGKEFTLVKLLFWEGWTDDDVRAELNQTCARYRVFKSETFKKIRESGITF